MSIEVGRVVSASGTKKSRIDVVVSTACQVRRTPVFPTCKYFYLRLLCSRGRYKDGLCVSRHAERGAIIECAAKIVVSCVLV